MMKLILTFIFSTLFVLNGLTQMSVGLNVYTVVSELEADNFINIAGGILAHKASGQDGKLLALIFNHSTQNIDSRQGEKRVPGFYGLAAPELEAGLNCPVCFLEGASCSSHNIALSSNECTQLIKEAFLDANYSTQVRVIERLALIKCPFKFKVRQFDWATEDETVRLYNRSKDNVLYVFREMRKTLDIAAHQESKT